MFLDLRIVKLLFRNWKPRSMTIMFKLTRINKRYKTMMTRMKFPLMKSNLMLTSKKFPLKKPELKFMKSKTKSKMMSARPEP